MDPLFLFCSRFNVLLRKNAPPPLTSERIVTRRFGPKMSVVRSSAVCAVVSLALWACCQCEPIFHNQFAVHVPSGREAADSIAGKHGFINIGQVSGAAHCGR